MAKLQIIVMMLVGACVLAACGTTRAVPMAGEGYEGVMFPARQSTAFEAATGLEFEGYWTPSSEQVAALESALPDYLQGTAPPQSPELWRRLPEYRRQYVGIVEEGEQLIYANFFCNPFAVEWQQEWVSVNDGGDCYFQLRYDPAQGTFSRLTINGEG